MSRNLESATSLERFLNRNVLFVQGIDQSAPKSEVLQVLNQVLKAPQQGRIDILTGPEGKNRGTAFLNFHNKEDAAAALEKWRFGLELRGRPLRMQYSSDREFKDVIQGPLLARFKVLVRNLPEELGPEDLYEKYKEYGEILQVHYSCDSHSQYYAIIQYLEIASVQAAIRATNREKVFNHVLMVENYKPQATYAPIPKNLNQPSYQQAQQQYSYANGGAAAGSRGAASSSGASGGGGGSSGSPLQGMTYAALQQLQEREAEEAAAAEAAAAEAAYTASYAEEHASSGGGGAAEAAAAPPPPAMLTVPSFYAAAPAGPAHASSTAAGSLLSLLTTALNRASMLDELLCCPITQEPLRDPVVAADGNTYERIAIEAWLRKSDTSPLTNQVMPSKALVPNNLIRKIVEDLKGSGDAAGAGGRRSLAGDAAAESASTAAAAATVVTAAAQESGATEAVQLSVPIPVPTPVPAAPPPAAEPAPQPEQQQQQAQHAYASQQQTQQAQQAQQQQYVMVHQAAHQSVHQTVHHAMRPVQAHHHQAHQQQQQHHAAAYPQAHMMQFQQPAYVAVPAQPHMMMQPQQQPYVIQHGGTTYFM